MSLSGAKKKLQKHGGHCCVPRCNATTHLTIDHIIPRQFMRSLGLDHLSETDHENFQVMCKEHNADKGMVLDYTNPKTLPLMKKYINMWIEKHADYFIQPEKRVYRLGVRCMCNHVHIPDHLDLEEWKNPPPTATAAQQEVRYNPNKNKSPYAPIDEDDW